MIRGWAFQIKIAVRNFELIIPIKRARFEMSND